MTCMTSLYTVNTYGITVSGVASSTSVKIKIFNSIRNNITLEIQINVIYINVTCTESIIFAHAVYV